MTITNMDRAACKTIRTEVDPAITAVASQLGLTAKVGNMSYNPSDGTVSVKIEFALPDAERRAFVSSCGIYGLTASQYGATFTSQGREFRLVGFNNRSPKYPIAAVSTKDGRMFKFTRAAVLAALQTEASK